MISLVELTKGFLVLGEAIQGLRKGLDRYRKGEPSLELFYKKCSHRMHKRHKRKEGITR
ncbi:MAG: hypothetical protein RLZZ408_849 [Verrucomicrobiota bacterium]